MTRRTTLSIVAVPISLSFFFLAPQALAQGNTMVFSDRATVALPLDTAHWQYWTAGFRCLDPPRMLGPAAGLFEQTNDGLQAYPDTFRSCVELHSDLPPFLVQS